MIATIDRFEGKFAVCELQDKSIINIEITRIPREAKEGDVIIIKGDKILLDKNYIKKLEKDINKLTEDFWS